MNATPNLAHPDSAAGCALLTAWRRTLGRRSGDTAIIEAASGKVCTFAGLDVRAREWSAANAEQLRALRGCAVAFSAPNGIEWLAMFIALARAGVVLLPLDPGEPAAAQRRLAGVVRAAAWWDGQRLQQTGVAKPFVGRGARLIKLTSGTTGQPRALVFSAGQLLADARQVTSTMGIRSSDVNYALIPFGHSYGLGNLTLPLLAHGVPIVCGSAPLPHVVAGELTRWNATVFPTVPAVIRALVAANLAADALAGVRLTISAGAALAPETAAAFAERFGRRIHNFYGSSETGGIAYDRTGAATLAGGVGRALRGVTISPRRGGRIEVCSAAVFTHGNRRRRPAGGCWVPPDRVRIDSGGELTLLGRTDRTVKLGGRRLNLGEVAARLRRLDGVQDVWVGIAAGAEPLLGAAVASARPAGELRRELLADTAPWKVPRKLAVLREFPLTARGKTDTRALEQAVFG